MAAPGSTTRMPRSMPALIPSPQPRLSPAFRRTCSMNSAFRSAAPYISQDPYRQGQAFLLHGFRADYATAADYRTADGSDGPAADGRLFGGDEYRTVQHHSL